MGVMGTLFGGIYLSTRGGGQKKQATPPIQASSKDEEKFIQYVASTLDICCPTLLCQ
jgi:F-type H+-transporting ATPase subunit k